MPFQNCAGLMFKDSAIRREAPASSGVYGLSNARGWVYVGETDNIQVRLFEHLDGKRKLPADRCPTGFNFEICAAHDRLARQRRLIQELRPSCNDAVPERI
jgi:hypothetical protein